MSVSFRKGWQSGQGHPGSQGTAQVGLSPQGRRSPGPSCLRGGGAREQPQLWASGVMLGCSVTPCSGTLLSSSRPGGGASGTQTGDKQTVVGPPGQGQPPRTQVAWLPDQSVAFGRDSGPGRWGPPPAPASSTLPPCTPPAAPASLLLTPQSSPCLLQAP